MGKLRPGEGKGFTQELRLTQGVLVPKPVCLALLFLFQEMEPGFR